MEQPDLPAAPQSQFAKRLAADPIFAARCAAVAHEVRRNAERELRAIEASQILTGEDLAIVINARASGQ